MPHIILEYSANIIEKNKLNEILLTLNQYVSKHLPAELLSCKARSSEFTSYCIGDGNPQNAFVHVSINIMCGRTFEQKTEVGNGILHLLKEFFNQSAKQYRLQITLGIEELPSTYFKYLSS